MNLNHVHGEIRGDATEGRLVKAAKSIRQTLDPNPELSPGSDDNNWIQMMYFIFEKEEQHNQRKAVLRANLAAE